MLPERLITCGAWATNQNRTEPAVDIFHYSAKRRRQTAAPWHKTQPFAMQSPSPLNYFSYS